MQGRRLGYAYAMNAARNAPAVLFALAALAVFTACGDATPTPPPAPTDTPQPTPTATATAPTGEPAPTATAPAGERGPTATPLPAGDSPATAAQGAASQTPTAAPPAPTDPPSTPTPFSRSTGEVDGVRFVVGTGSEATFSVDEELARVTVPNYEAVMRTDELSGEVRLDGGDSLIEVGLHGMTSDEPFRDRYVRSRMFPNQPAAEVAFGDLTPLPDGFADGDAATADVTGTLRINGMEVPLTFAVEARDDGDVVYVVGRSSFTWDDIGEPVPTARSVVSVGDEVRVEVLLTLTPTPG